MSRGRSPLPGVQPAQHWAGLLLSSLEPATCWAGSATRGRACAGEAGTGDRRLPLLGGSALSASRTPRQPGGSALPPLSPAPSLPPLGGSAQTTRSMQCATPGQDKGPRGLLPGTLLLWHCGAPKPHRSLASFLSPARLLPAPASSAAAARSCRGCGLQAQTPAGEGRKRVITPGRSTALRPARSEGPAAPTPRPETGGSRARLSRGLGSPSYLGLRERHLRRP